MTSGFFSEQALFASLGLLGMKERAHALNGSVSFEETSGGGAAVILRLPVKSGKKS